MVEQNHEGENHQAWAVKGERRPTCSTEWIWIVVVRGKHVTTALPSLLVITSQWRIYVVKFWMRAPLRIQILSISWSFWENLAKLYVDMAPLEGWRPHLGETLLATGSVISDLHKRLFRSSKSGSESEKYQRINGNIKESFRFRFCARFCSVWTQPFSLNIASVRNSMAVDRHIVTSTFNRQLRHTSKQFRRKLRTSCIFMKWVHCWEGYFYSVIYCR